MGIKHTYTKVDMNKNQLLNVVVENSNTPPLLPVTGQLYYDNLTSDNGKLFVWNGAWIDLTKQGVLDGDYTDITVSGGGTSWNIKPNIVGYSEIQKVVAANVLLGSTVAGGNVTELDAATVRGILNVAAGATYYDNNMAKDAVGGSLVDSTTVDFTYNAVAKNITAAVINDSITYSKLQNSVANNVLLGNNSGADSDFEELTGTDVTAMLDVFTATKKGLAPASGGGTTKWLRSDAQWQALPESFSGFSITGNISTQAVGMGDNIELKGADHITTTVTKVGTVVTTTFTLKNNCISNANLAVMPAWSIKVNNSASVSQPGTEVSLTTNSILGRLAAGMVAIPIVSTLDSASDSNIPTALSVKTAIGAAVTNGMKYLGSFDPTSNLGAGLPALKSITSSVGDTYTVTVAGTYVFTTGGSVILEVGDTMIAEETGVLSDASKWTIINRNLDGVVIGPISAVDNRIAVFSSSTGKVIKDGGVTLQEITQFISSASTTEKGLVEEATSAEAIAGTSSGNTGARLFVNPSSLNSVLGVEAPAANPAVGKRTNARIFRQVIGGAISMPVTHGLDNLGVIAQVWRVAGDMDLIECEVRRTSKDITTFIFSTAPAAGEFLAVITG